jgi:hypothetical protein
MVRIAQQQLAAANCSGLSLPTARAARGYHQQHAQALSHTYTAQQEESARGS